MMSLFPMVQTKYSQAGRIKEGANGGQDSYHRAKNTEK